MNRREFITGMSSGLALSAIGINIYKTRKLIQDQTSDFTEFTAEQLEKLDKYSMPIALSSIASLGILLYFWDHIYLILGFILLTITGLAFY
tara:strand:+ start:82 stop:354 length:273 start_codon:yes stop_codon:yes gene_type:complete